MVDLNTLSPSALKAAVKGGTKGWGVSASEHGARYSEPLPKRAGRRRTCWCGCGGPQTHMGAVKGIALINGCELLVARWVKDPASAVPQSRRYQIGDEVIVQTREGGPSWLAVVIDPSPMQMRIRVRYPHGGDCLVPVAWLALVRAANATNANVIPFEKRGS